MVTFSVSVCIKGISQPTFFAFTGFPPSVVINCTPFSPYKDDATKYRPISPEIAACALQNRATELSKMLSFDDRFIEHLTTENILLRQREHHHEIMQKALKDRWGPFMSAMASGHGKEMICRLYRCIYSSYLDEGGPDQHFDALLVIRRSGNHACIVGTA